MPPDPTPPVGFPIPREVFRQAYEATGLWPQRYVWLRSRRFGPLGRRVECGCPIGVLLAANDFGDEAKAAASEWDASASILELLEGLGYRITKDQLDSFVAGVDHTWRSRQDQCYHDGVAVREEVMRPILMRLKGEVGNE